MKQGISALRQIEMRDKGRFSRIHNPRLSFYFLLYRVIVQSNRQSQSRIIPEARRDINV